MSVAETSTSSALINSADSQVDDSGAVHVSISSVAKSCVQTHERRHRRSIGGRIDRFAWGLYDIALSIGDWGNDKR